MRYGLNTICERKLPKSLILHENFDLGASAPDFRPSLAKYYVPPGPGDEAALRETSESVSGGGIERPDFRDLET